MMDSEKTELSAMEILDLLGKNWIRHSQEGTGESHYWNRGFASWKARRGAAMTDDNVEFFTIGETEKPGIIATYQIWASKRRLARKLEVERQARLARKAWLEGEKQRRFPCRNFD
ncbi:MAG: hypothetical protein ACOYM2_16560 [Rectinemataceae bacterium]